MFDDKGVIAFFGAGITIIMGFFWNLNKSMNEKIANVADSNTAAHNRITKQAEINNDKYARRDDVEKMEKRIIDSFERGFADIKEDIRSLSKTK